MSQHPVLYQQHFAVPYSSQQRSYQLIKLPSGIHGLLITDPSEDLASCCVSVAAGHHSNPDSIPGLAHLCEHMVCLSSKDFPEIDGFKKAVYLAGGTRNALTSNETTSFFFSIPITSSSQQSQSDFESILDIFTSNFKNPSFEANYSNREIYAVDNEHTLNKTKKNRLAFQGYKLLANKEHQFARFSTGDFDSLTNSSKKYDIKSKLQEFFKSEYTPDKMVFVLRGPQSLNYLQKLAISKFGKIGNDSKKVSLLTPISSSSNLDSNIYEKAWSTRYHTKAYTPANTQRVVLINKDLDPILRIAFPVCLQNFKTLTKEQINFYINFWCDLFGSESNNTIASILSSKELIVSITTKTSNVTYNDVLLEIEMVLTTNGLNQISSIIDVIFNYIGLFSVNNTKFLKHLAKSMSQFNGIGIYNFLNAEAESNTVWEAKTLSINLLQDIKSYGQFFLNSLFLYDQSTPGFSGAYSETADAKSWWLKESQNFCLFINEFISLDNSIASFVGNVAKTNLSWVCDLPSNYDKEMDFDFEYKIAKLNPNVINLENQRAYKLNLSPPNIFAEDIIDKQLLLLQSVNQTITASSDAALGYSVKNISSLAKPKLYYYDQGCQLWIKTEIDNEFKNKVLLTVELINSKITAHPSLVAMIEILVQLVRNRINEYLYPAMTMNYVYDIYPSFKGDTGILLHVSGPNHKFNNVLMIIVYEIKLIVDSFKTSISPKEFEKAKNALILKYENAENLSSMESAVLGLMATIEEYTWMIDQKLNAYKGLTIDDMSVTLPQVFSSCYMTSFLQGDVNGNALKDDVLPVISKLVGKFEGEDYNFPSSVLLPPGSNYYVHTLTKDDTNCVEYFIQTGLRDDLYKRSITKFIAFLMSSDLVNKIRTEYQLGYIALVGLKSFRKTQGIHISVVSGSHSAENLDLKLDDIVVEWYEQKIKKLKSSQLIELIDKFITLEKTSNKSLSTTSGKSSIFFGLLGGSGGDKRIVKQHNSNWEQIENKTYAFSNSSEGEDSIDFQVVQNLTVGKVTEFIITEILPSSSKRSKVSVQVDSKCSKEEVEGKFKSIQLYIYLSSMGLPIKKEHLDEILEQSGDSQFALGKNLYKHYREKGKSLTLIASVVAKLSKSMLSSVGSESTTRAESAVPKTEIDHYHLREWQTNIGYVRDTILMKQRLQKF